MTFIINPGSGAVARSGNGWTNTFDGARRIAFEWLKNMHDEGMRDVNLLPANDLPTEEGRWEFRFEHAVTGVVVSLVTHGIDDMKAYEADGHIFGSRIYWRGSSSSNPDLSDWKADGFEPVLTYRRAS